MFEDGKAEDHSQELVVDITVQLVLQSAWQCWTTVVLILSTRQMRGVGCSRRRLFLQLR